MAKNLNSGMKEKERNICYVSVILKENCNILECKWPGVVESSWWIDAGGQGIRLTMNKGARM